MKIYKKGHPFLLVLLFIVVLLSIELPFKDDHVMEKDFRDPKFWIYTILVLLFCTWGFSHPDGNIRNATFHAAIALFIAYFAHLDMIFSAFVFIWILTYYRHYFI